LKTLYNRLTEYRAAEKGHAPVAEES
jgi:hypothetical protein